jgi:hypothetical protein
MSKNKRSKKKEYDPSQHTGFKKFQGIDSDFHKMIDSMQKLPVEKRDYIHQFPLFVGHVNLARYLFFYDLYKQCCTLSGNIADIGTWKGSSFLFMAKLVRLFETYSITQVHGFDWFQGMKPSSINDCIDVEGEYIGDYDLLIKLVELQQLQDIAVIHKLDLCKDLDVFFEQHKYMRFKMIFLDCGIKEVLEASLSHFWPRLIQGGILIVDHYNTETSPSESQIVDDTIGKNLIRHCPYNRQPTAYIKKDF